MIRTMLNQAALGKQWWGYALLYATYIRNRCSTRALNGGVPYVMWSGRMPNYNMIKPFGCVAYVYVPDKLRSKLDMKAVKGVFVGIAMNRKCYSIYNPWTKKIIYSNDVTFVEDMKEPGELLSDRTLEPTSTENEQILSLRQARQRIMELRPPKTGRRKKLQKKRNNLQEQTEDSIQAEGEDMKINEGVSSMDIDSTSEGIPAPNPVTSGKKLKEELKN